MILRFAASAFSTFLQTMITLAPLLAKSFAVAYPIPVLDPAKRRLCLIYLLQHQRLFTSIRLFIYF